MLYDAASLRPIEAINANAVHDLALNLPKLVFPVNELKEPTTISQQPSAYYAVLFNIIMLRTFYSNPLKSAPKFPIKTAAQQKLHKFTLQKYCILKSGEKTRKN